MFNKKIITLIILLAAAMFAGISCKKLTEAKPPVNEIVSNDAFNDSATVVSVLLNIYTQFGISGGSIEGYFAPYPSLYADELNPVNSNQTDNEFYTNSITAANSTDAAIWSRLYFVIYECNALLQGITGSANLSSSLVRQISGEAKFLRAYAYFLLVNVYGNVPLVLSNDVTITAIAPRSPVSKIYEQVFADLNDAVSFLTENYPSAEKVRANKYAAEALLAKVNLYNKNWKEAEGLSNDVISSGLYTPLEAPQNVFLKNSTEAILQFYEKYGYTWSGTSFQPFYGSPNYAVTPGLLHSFEQGDLRKMEWVDSAAYNGSMVYYPSKYKNNGFTAVNTGEYTMCLRIADIFLVRAEARAEQDETENAVADVNIIRTRANLPLIKLPITKDSCLQMIQQERRTELFTEWGNRFFDLKRTGKINEVLGALKQQWQPTDTVFPIPQIELNNNPFLTQNPGY